MLLPLAKGGVEVLLKDEPVLLEVLSPKSRSRLAADKDADAGVAESNRDDPPSLVRDENKDWCWSLEELRELGVDPGGELLEDAPPAPVAAVDEVVGEGDDRVALAVEALLRVVVVVTVEDGSSAARGS